MTKEKWASLQGKGQWDIQAALRGPDSNFGETLKWFTTAVIRGQMAEVIRVGGLVNKDLQLVILPRGESGLTEAAQEQFNSKRGWNHHHFCSHVAEAAHWMELPILYIEPTIWHKVMSGGSIIAAAEAILQRAAEFGREVENTPKSAFGVGHHGVYSSRQVEELARHKAEGKIYS